MQHYIVAFDNPHTARKVQYFASPELALRVERGLEYDVTQDISDALCEMHVPYQPGPGSSISISTSCKLYIPKMRPRLGGMYHPLNDAGLHLCEVPIHNIFMMPFEKNLGIILSYDLVLEDDDEMVLACNIVDPCDDVNSVQWSLKSRFRKS